MFRAAAQHGSMLPVGALSVGKVKAKVGGSKHTPSRGPVHYVLDMGSVADMGSDPRWGGGGL